MQLEHDVTEKGSFRDPHGHVAIVTADGKEVARDDAFQHNINYHDREDKTEELVAELTKTAGKVAEEIKPEPELPAAGLNAAAAAS